MYNARIKELKKHADACRDSMTNAFAFCENVFKDGQVLLIFVTELTVNYYTAQFISRYGCEAYFRHNKGLLTYDGWQRIQDDMKRMKDEDLYDLDDDSADPSSSSSSSSSPKGALS